MEEYTKAILKARVYDVARETSLDLMPELSRRLDNQVWLKREDQQPVFSYKIRGAYNLMSSLTEEQKATGVITASAGNHAQGVALSAKRLGINALIVMPKTTPEIKINAVRRLGAEILLHGNTYDDASDQAKKLVAEKGLTYIPPYDHPLIIAGQGTVAMEILRQHPDRIDAIFVPVGGGGLIAGVAAYVKSLSPEIRIIGVEADDAPGMTRSLEKGEVIELESVGIFADGAAVRTVGTETFRLAKELVDEMLLVSTEEICAAVRDTFEDTRSIPEPAGALALAGLKQYVNRNGIQGQTLIAIYSGSNVNFDRLRNIAELADLGEQREALLGVTIPERPGSFREFCRTLGPRSITEFNYRYADATTAHVFTGIRLKNGSAETAEILANLRDRDYPVEDLTHNVLAKQHARYMVGGHSGGVQNERLYHFEFPERPGALLHFLNQVGERWNISLFHYRNHGAAYGRVLMGIQVPDTERAEFQLFLDGLGLEYSEEADNPVYTMFLS